MAYDEGLAQRMREALAGRPELTEKKMFGGIAFFLNGNMACGVNGDEMIVRVGPDGYHEALGDENARPFDITGRPMKGWVSVEPDGLQEDADLAAWVDKGTAFAASLPAK